MKERNYGEALIALQKALRITPGDVDPYYNLACLHAIKGEIRQGLAHLSRAVSIDRSVRDWAKRDTDLENLRGVPEFENIIRGVGHRTGQ